MTVTLAGQAEGRGAVMLYSQEMWGVLHNSSLQIMAQGATKGPHRWEGSEEGIQEDHGGRQVSL